MNLEKGVLDCKESFLNAEQSSLEFKESFLNFEENFLNFEEYIVKRDEAINLLNNIESEIGKQKYISEKIENMNRNKFVISVLGHFSTGKSTLLNLIMGFKKDILPVDDLASTAAVTVLKEPPKDNYEELLNKAEIIFNTNNKKIVNIDEIEKYVKRNKNINVESEIKQVNIFLKSKYLQNGIELIDTPGINSIYALHKDIIKKQIQKSDACIYLFSYDKPGLEVEFKFLNYVNKYMDRIFFLLNKIDLEDKSEKNNSSTQTVDELKKKIHRFNINAKEDKLYPISLKWYRMGLVYESGLEEFIQGLNKYLINRKNLNDRIINPLRAVSAKLQTEKDEIEQKISICNKDTRLFRSEIQEMKINIDKRERELKEKKGILKQQINQEMRLAKSRAESLSFYALNKIKEKIIKLGNEIDLQVVDFARINIELYEDFLNISKQTQEYLVNKLVELLEDNCEDNFDNTDVKIKIEDLINKTFDIEKIEIQNPEFEFGKLDEIDKELNRKKREYEAVRQKMSSVMNDKLRESALNEQIKSIKKELKELRAKKESEIIRLGDNNPEYQEVIYSKEINRKGVIGKLVDNLIGNQVLEEKKKVFDDTMFRYNQQRREEVLIEFSEKEQEKEKILMHKMAELMSMGNLNSRYKQAKEELEFLQEEYLKENKTETEKKKRLEESIIKISKEKYQKDIENAHAEYKRQIIIFIDKQSKFINNIMQEIFNFEGEEIERMRDNLCDISILGNKTSDELQEEVRILYSQREKFIKSLTSLKDFIKKEGANV